MLLLLLLSRVLLGSGGSFDCFLGFWGTLMNVVVTMPTGSGLKIQRIFNVLMEKNAGTEVL